MYKHFIWKKWKETNYLYSIENGNGDCVKETTTQPNSEKKKNNNNNNNNDDGKHRLAICLHFLSIYFIELDKGYI
jgi:hypothetical protein